MMELYQAQPAVGHAHGMEESQYGDRLRSEKLEEGPKLIALDSA